MLTSRRALSIFSLVMINVIAVDSLRTLPIGALLGFSLISYYFLAALAFFIPLALVTAELATTLPNTGGIYLWVREAFGTRFAFVTIWLQWIYNIVWYPTILAFISTTLATVFAPDMGTNRYFILITSLVFFWLFTLFNCFGMRISGLISILGATLGTLLPMAGIILVAIIWAACGQPLGIHSSDSLLPESHSLGNLSLFTQILFGLVGLEMSAVHAEDVRNPQRDYPRALLFSVIIIISALTMASLSVAIILPAGQVSLISGLIDAYHRFFSTYHVPWLSHCVAILIILGGASGVSAWIIGSAKLLLVCARDGTLPHPLARVNRHGMPVPVLVLQGVVFSALCSIFSLMDSIDTAYLILSELSAQMALIVYIMIFLSAIKLRFTYPQLTGSFEVPGGRWGMLAIAGTGLSCCVLAIIIGFIPPAQIQTVSSSLFISILGAGLVGFLIVPFLWLFLFRRTQESA
ncbi:MAG: amino acid permease [Legionellaceae bacterium]|nr:amino acid permease [Legionellaceae bacterium]